MLDALSVWKIQHRLGCMSRDSRITQHSASPRATWISRHTPSCCIFHRTLIHKNLGIQLWVIMTLLNFKMVCAIYYRFWCTLILKIWELCSQTSSPLKSGNHPGYAPAQWLLDTTIKVCTLLFRGMPMIFQRGFVDQDADEKLSIHIARCQ